MFFVRAFYDWLAITIMTPLLVSYALSLYLGILKPCIIIALSQIHITKLGSAYEPYMAGSGTSPRPFISKSRSPDTVVLVGKMVDSCPAVLLVVN
jgi:hypothetical protein